MPIRYLKEHSFVMLRETDMIRFSGRILGSLVSLQLLKPVPWLFVHRLTSSLPRGVGGALQHETKTAAGDTNSLPIIWIQRQ